MLTIPISVENLCGGFGMAVLIAWMSGLTSTSYTATQYAVFSSLMTLPAKFIGGFSGLVVDAHGYAFFFVYVSSLGIPAIIAVAYLLKTNSNQMTISRSA
jgi:PAT family beta-lactamase induction signal transducer AmpG